MSPTDGLGEKLNRRQTFANKLCSPVLLRSVPEIIREEQQLFLRYSHNLYNLQREIIFPDLLYTELHSVNYTHLQMLCYSTVYLLISGQLWRWQCLKSMPFSRRLTWFQITAAASSLLQCFTCSCCPAFWCIVPEVLQTCVQYPEELSEKLFCC